MFIFDFRLLKICKRFKPDLFLSHGSIYAAQVAWLLNKKHYTFEDSNCKEQILLFKPFSDIILSPDAITDIYGKNHIKFNGFLQNAYLHPNYYKPNNKIYDYLRIDKSERYFLLRFVGLEATHDRKLKPIELESTMRIIELLEKYGKVFISSERKLDDILSRYEVKIPPKMMHDLIYFSDLLIGDSGAMSNEAALLGVPNIVIVDADVDVHEKLVSLGLKYHVKSYSQELLLFIKKIVEDNKQKEELRRKVHSYFNNSIDLTEFLIWLVENHHKIKNNTYIKKSQWSKYVQ
jgi:hypothetical protein